MNSGSSFAKNTKKTLTFFRNSVADYVLKASVEDDITGVSEFKDEDEKIKIYFEKMNYKN